MHDVVILAGGFGTRLKSISGELPKPMVDVSGTPFLYRLMQYLEKQGCKRIVLSLSFQADYIIDRVVSDSPVDCKIDFVVEDEPLGTGGAIKLASTKIEDDKFIVLNGDTFCEINYQELISSSVNVDLLISGIEIDDVTRYGTLDIDAHGNVNKMSEKGKSGPGIINSGTYVISKKIISAYSGDKFSFETDFIPHFKGIFKAYTSKGYFIDIGIPDDYYKACEKFK